MRIIGVFFIVICFLIIGCGNGEEHEFKSSGTIEATMVTISARGAGEVVEFTVIEGQHVAKDTELLRIDTRDLELQRDQVRAQIDLADAQLRLALSGARQEDRDQALRGMEAAEFSLNQAQADYGRIKQLRATGSVPQKQLDDAKSLMDIRQAQFNGMREAYQKLQRGLRPEEIEIARATKAQTEASLAIIEKRIEDGTVRSPRDGTVTETFVERGEYVMTGRDLLRIVDLSDVTLRVYVQAIRLPFISLGDDVAVYIDGQTAAFRGVISHISDIAEFTPKTIQTENERIKLVFAIKVTLANDHGQLKPGMPADAIFTLKKTGDNSNRE